eukprot:Plantae.Rhodophyta-Rhodochaete_pulchella.ctg2103.p1 GENE.Plantae.Rhodophyta-Rhodochaete_pulchella.ctg2103~~Plantae.Rhodophyta-Rhodochaete_pulchella.ctg2103.p1  ORF type:complete len:374 (+),score=76.80 Plantae.Rhodophyta-Rhodochaete_pulchella.ctg2103:526-1647(+)
MDNSLQIRALRVALQRRCAFVRSKIREDNYPSDEELTNFVEIVKDETRNLAAAAAIDESIAEEQIQRLQTEDQAPPAVTDLDDLISDMVEYFRGMEIQAANASVQPSDDELGSLRAACEQLWELDINRLEPQLDYSINLQERSERDEDTAPGPLFRYVDKHVFNKPTYLAFHYLLDNYERETGVSENTNEEEKQENWDFLNAVMATPCMQYCFRYASARGVLKDADDEQGFKSFLYRLWFYLYRRETSRDSSGFEHVFVGEERNGKIIGFHNWIQIMIEEHRQKLDYKGYLHRSGPEPDAMTQILSVQFAWEGDLKPVSTCFIGVSPEFELALYTLCFLCGEEENRIKVGPYECTIKCYRLGSMIGTAFPQLD